MAHLTRRQSLGALGAVALATALPGRLASAQPRYQFGYAAITWGGNDRQALQEIADVGFRGVQLRTAAVQAFGETPTLLRDLLQQHRLTFVALSSGNLGLDPARGDEEMARHVAHARFLRDCGGLYLQIIDARPARAITAADYAAMGRRLTELGTRTADLGIPLGYHHHMGSLGEAPEEIDRILDATDPAFVRLQLDTAHYLQGGGDPAAAIRKYAERLLFLHIKDVRVQTPDAGATPGSPASRPYRFVELGQGRADIKAVFRALDDVGFKGWLVVELDTVTEPGRSPRASAEMNRDYLRNTIGIRPDP
jgi:inosose dehydratase